MTAKIVCRLLDADDQLLGWVEHHAAVRGDGCLRADGPVVLHPERAGVSACVSLHWADVNVETRVPYASAVWPGGAGLVLFDHDAMMVRLGAMPKGLPPVTVGSVRIGIPKGQMGARG